MEIFCIFLLPSVFVLWMVQSGQSFGWFSFACFAPTAALLLVGGLYWKAKLASISDSETALGTLLDIAERLKMPLLILTCAGVGATLCDILWISHSESPGDRIGGFIATSLATLEYVNYYGVQLQHFDHGPDFRRLIRGQGFRRSHLNKDLAERKTHRHGDAG